MLFYTRALDFLETLDINPDEEDQGKRGWHQMKMLFEGDDCQALQTLIDNNTISAEAQCTPSLALNAIQSVIKEDIYFWNYHDKILSYFHQLPDEGIHSLNTHITTLVNKSKFTNEETIKIMILQHAVMYHEVRDWIFLKNQNTLTYRSLLAHCKQLEQFCEQFQQSKAQGYAQLTSHIIALATTSSVHADTATFWNPKCSHWGYSHSHVSYLAFGWECYNCHSMGHFTALCRRPHTSKHPSGSYSKFPQDTRGRPHRSSSCWHSSRLPSRGRLSHWSLSCQSHQSISSNHSPCLDFSHRRSPHCSCRSSTPYRTHQVSHFTTSTSTPKQHQKVNCTQIKPQMDRHPFPLCYTSSPNKAANPFLWSRSWSWC